MNYLETYGASEIGYSTAGRSASDRKSKICSAEGVRFQRSKSIDLREDPPCSSEDKQIRFWEPEGRDSRRFAVCFSQVSALCQFLSFVNNPISPINPSLSPFSCISLAGWRRSRRPQPSKPKVCEFVIFGVGAGKGAIRMPALSSFRFFVFSSCFREFRVMSGVDAESG